MSEKQQTIKEEISISGVGLHTGTKTNVRVKPAGENKGIEFVRVDIEGQPHIKACPENIVTETDIPRCTAIGKDGAIIYTVEHLMSVFNGLGIDNACVEIDGNELPGLDGSSLEYLTAINKTGLAEQNAEREYIRIKEPVGVSSNGASIFVVPEETLSISYTLSYRHKYLKNQFFTTSLSREVFENDIAPCRTFCLEEEAKELQASGLGKGASYDNTLVVGENGVIKNKVRFEDEFARHKVLDFLGDLYLLGKRIRGNVFAVKSGHYLNIELLKLIEKQNKKGFVPDFDFTGKNELDIQEIMKILPHRYPFLLVDRILEIEPKKKAVGLKNVTMNENFFTGHFPTRPVMPGVLMVEAMAQTGGVLVLTNDDHRGKLALFMGTDKVKFRKVVQPGDQLIFEVEIIRDRSRSAALHGVTKVNGEVVAEADILFSFVDSSFLV